MAYADAGADAGRMGFDTDWIEYLAAGGVERCDGTLGVLRSARSATYEDIMQRNIKLWSCLGLIGVTLATSGGAALAQAAAKPGDDGPVDGKTAIDIKSQAKDFRVYTNDTGRFYVVPTGPKPLDGMVFSGDGKTMYQQTIIGGGTSGDGSVDFSIWAPRVVGLQQGGLAVAADGSATASCNADHDTKLTPASPAESTRVLTKATFFPPLWKRQSKFLARNDDGIYFFVDVLRAGGKGHRVFVGTKGAMKMMPMTTLVDDAAGQIYGTKRGELRIVANAGEKATWRKGKKVETLTILDPQDNRYLIYRELGIYGQLGTICDDE
jgi:hypothetical protein